MKNPQLPRTSRVTSHFLLALIGLASAGMGAALLSFSPGSNPHPSARAEHARETPAARVTRPIQVARPRAAPGGAQPAVPSGEGAAGEVVSPDSPAPLTDQLAAAQLAAAQLTESPALDPFEGVYLDGEPPEELEEALEALEPDVESAPEPPPELDPDIAKRMDEAPELELGGGTRAADERDDLVQKLRSSGDPNPTWPAYFEQVQREWADATAADTSLGDPSDWECYQRGCMVTIRSTTRATAERYAQLTQATPLTRAWQGAIYRSAPIPDGPDRVETTFAFLPRPTSSAVR